MGVCCSCLEALESDARAEQMRLDALHAGAKFMRNDTYLGLTSKELWVRLSNEKDSLAWRTTGAGSWTAAEFGEIDLTVEVGMVKSHGLQGIQFFDKSNKVIFDIQAEDTVVRDMWVIALSELMQGWVLHPETKPQTVSAAGKSAREAEMDSHFKAREAEFLKNREAKLAAREAAAAARKAKYQSVAGKTYSPLQTTTV